MHRTLLPLALLVACGGQPASDTPELTEPEGRMDGLDLRLPGAVVRAGHASLGVVGLAALAELGGGEARAEPPGPAATPATEEIEVDADHLTLAGQGSGGVLTGHVRLRRGALEITCDRLETRSDAAGALVEARASGNVRLVRGPLVATAASARLDLSRGEVVLDGPVRLVRAEGTLEGARVVVSLADGRVSVERVRGRLRLRAGGSR